MTKIIKEIEILLSYVDKFYSCVDLPFKEDLDLKVNLDLSDTTGLTNIGDFAFSGCDSLETVNYKGTAEQWKKISIGLGNEYLTGATINYNYRE